MSESYLGGSRGLAALGSSILDDALDSSTYWGEPSLPGHRGGGEAPEAGWLAGLPPCGVVGFFQGDSVFWGQVGSSPPGGEEAQGTPSPVRSTGCWRARRTTPTPRRPGTLRKTTTLVGMRQPPCGGGDAGGDVPEGTSPGPGCARGAAYRPSCKAFALGDAQGCGLRLVTYRLASSFPGHFYSGQSSSGSGLRTAASRVGSFLWQVLTSPGEWRAGGGFPAAPFFPGVSPLPTCRACCSLIGWRGFIPAVGASSGTEGTSLPDPRLRLRFSPGSSVRGMAVLRAGSCLAPPHRRGSPLGRHPPLQVNVVVGRRDGGSVGENPPDPGEGLPRRPRHAWGGHLVPKPGWALLSLWPPSRRVLRWVKVGAVLQTPLSSPCSRRYPWLKRSLLLLLLLLLLAAAAYGESAWLDLLP